MAVPALIPKSWNPALGLCVHAKVHVDTTACKLVYTHAYIHVRTHVHVKYGAVPIEAKQRMIINNDTAQYR